MYFPTYSLNNFYQNPDDIVHFANLCEYERDVFDRWAGVRSKCLSIINKQLFHYSCEKVLKMIFGKTEVTYKASNYFQKITNEDINFSKEGWAHQDPDMLTAIIYLTKNNNSGTKILNNPHEGFVDFNQSDNIPSRKYGKENFEEIKEKNNSPYIDSVYHNSTYNSLLVFQGINPHKAVFDLHDNLERVTQIIFFREICSSWYPIPEMNSRV